MENILAQSNEKVSSGPQNGQQYPFWQFLVFFKKISNPKTQHKAHVHCSARGKNLPSRGDPRDHLGRRGGPASGFLPIVVKWLASGPGP